MRFDPESNAYVFSRDQFIDPQQEAEIINENRSRNVEMMKNFFKPSMGQTSSVTSGMTGKTIIVLIVVALVVAAFIVFAKLSFFRVVIGLFGALFVFFGLFMIFSKSEENYSANGTGMKQRTNGIFVFLIGTVISGGAVLSNYLPTSQVMVVGIGALFIISGLLFVGSFVNEHIRAGGLVGEQISAECIGYVRSVATSGENNSYSYVVASPVLEYYYNGSQYTAIDSIRFQKNDMPVALGETIDVTIDPKDPYYVTSMVKKNEGKGSVFMQTVFPMIFVLVGAGIMWFGLTHDMSRYEVRNNKLPSLTDEVVEKKIGAYDWTIEKITVREKRYDDEIDGWLVVYGDEKYFSCTAEIAEDYEIGKDYYLVFDAEGFIKAVYRADDWNYEISSEHEQSPAGEF
ncbi:MAG: hypothetical protein IJ571_06830 [Ruminococcus sp.]|nr:hypothetical protein [Ruminococcus sp.]